MTDQPHIIVSLTSIPSRYWLLPLVLHSLLRQRYRNFTIELNVVRGKVPFVPWLMSKCGSRLRVIEVEQDMGPATKFLYTLRRHESTPIAVCDDDQFYPREWLGTLVRWSQDLGGDVCVTVSGTVLPSTVVDERVRRQLKIVTGTMADGRIAYRQLSLGHTFDRSVSALWPRGLSGYLLPSGLGRRLDGWSHYEECMAAVPANVIEAVGRQIADDVVMGAYLYRAGVPVHVVPVPCRTRPIVTSRVDSLSDGERAFRREHGLYASLLTYLAFADRGWLPRDPEVFG